MMIVVWQELINQDNIGMEVSADLVEEKIPEDSVATIVAAGERV